MASNYSYVSHDSVILPHVSNKPYALCLQHLYSLINEFIWDFFPVILFLAVPRRLSCFVSLVILDAVCRYLSLFLLYIKIEIDKNRC